MAFAACYPGGLTAPSVTTRVIDIGQGWPLATDIDAAIVAGTTLVSIIPIPGTTGNVVTPFDWNPGVVVAPVHGMTAAATPSGFILTGQPGVGEYATAIVDGVVTSVAAVSGDTASSIAAELAAAIPGASASSGTVTISTFHSLVVRIGAPATMGQISHRQRQNFQVTVWAPSPSDRTAVARPIDTALKASNTFLLPDTSTAILLATGTNIDDKRQETSGFHRALIYSVEWDNLYEFPAWEITSVNVSLPADNGTATAVI